MAMDVRQSANAPRIGPVGLALSEQLVLASMRAWAKARLAGDEPRDLIVSGLTQVASPRVATAMIALMEHVERHAVRGLAFHGVACPGYSQDEQRIVVASGVAQVSPMLAEQLLGSLVRRPDVCAIVASLLHIALDEAGYPLPPRLGGAPVEVTLH
jgi:hypothetical protein